MLKKPRYIGLGLNLTDSNSIRFHINPTAHGISFGPVIAGYDIHVTAFEKDGIFHSHLTYSKPFSKEPRYEPIITLTHEEMVKFLRNEGVESISLLLEKLEKYSETDEALVMTDEGKKLFRELLKGIITINVKGRKLLFEFQFGHLVNKEKVLQEKVDRFFKVGTVSEAFKNNIFSNQLTFSPDLKPILKFGDEIYIYARNPLEILEPLKLTTSSIEEMFRELEKTELKFAAKFAELFGIRRLFIELERRNLLEKCFPHSIS